MRKQASSRQSTNLSSMSFSSSSALSMSKLSNRQSQIIPHQSPQDTFNKPKNFLDRMQKLIKLNQLEGIASLQYTFCTTGSTDTIQNQPVTCGLAVPTINFIKVPLKITCNYDKKVKFGRPFTCEYTIKNIADS